MEEEPFMSNRDIEGLKSLGLSETTAEIYLSLVRSPAVQSFEEVSTLCKHASEKIERALRELVDRGLLMVEGNRFIVTQPKQALNAILEQREKEAERSLETVRSVVASLQRSLEPLYWETRAGIRPEEILEPLADLSAMELRTARMIGNAQSEILIFAERFDWYDKVSEVLAQALDRGAKVKVLMLVADKASLKRAEELEKLGVQVKHCAERWYPVRGTLVDGRELVFLIWATKKDVPKPVYFKPHYTTNPGIIKIFLDAYDKRWQEAKALTKLNRPL
jgi:sugar-specific transcriptional regulator TrmB